MSLTCGFYNSLNQDRKYNTEHISRLFDGLISDGVFSFIGTSLVVQENTGMSILVGTGRAWFNHTWTNNDALLPLSVEQSELILNRIDIVVLEVDTSDDVRNNDIIIIKGTPGSSPVAPILEQGPLKFQYPLAQIYIGAGVSTITQANITNKIGTDACPFVTGLVQQISIETILGQWQSEFEQWYIAAQAEVDAWYASSQAGFDTWYRESQDEFDTWLAYIQNLFGDDPLGVIQGQIDLLKYATGIAYDNTISGLTAGTVQAALDEINVKAGRNENGVVLVNKETTFDNDEITETFTDDGSTLVTTFNPDGTITTVHTISGSVKTKTTTFNADGSISEVIS